MQEVNSQVKEVLEDISDDRRLLRRLERKYSKEYKGGLKIFKIISDPKFRSEKCSLKQQIASQKDVIEEKTNYLYSVCLAPMDSTMQFFADVITEIEGVPYVYRKFDLEDDYFKVMGIVTNNLALYFSGEETVGVIGRKEFFHGLEGIECDDSYDLEAYFERKNEKFIMIEDADMEDNEITLFEDMNVPENLTADFPYLSKVCTDIVAKKLREPEASSEDIYAEYLSDLRSSQAAMHPMLNIKK